MLVDTGIMHGADVVAAVALGARAALVGRAYLYGLMAGVTDVLIIYLAIRFIPKNESNWATEIKLDVNFTLL